MKATGNILRTAALAAAVALLAAPSQADTMKLGDLKADKLARMAEQADGPEDFRELGMLYERRAELLEEKAERHDELEQRYASAPASLLAKRRHHWNTPDRQRQLAEKARADAEAAREAAALQLARADAQETDVD